jgi:hypothetical protein
MDSCKEMKDFYQELADSSRNLADSYKSLKVMAADLLFSFERFKIPASSTDLVGIDHHHHLAANRASANTNKAPANIELAMDYPLKLSVVPELANVAPAICSTKCRGVPSKQCEAASASLAGTGVFTLVQKAAVLPASYTATASSLQSVKGEVGVFVPAASVLVAAKRVPPRPLDLHISAPEYYEPTKVMERNHC